MVGVITPPSELEGIAILVTVVFCFVMGLIAVYFATMDSILPMITSLITGGFFVLIVFGLKSLFQKIRSREQK